MSDYDAAVRGFVALTDHDWYRFLLACLEERQRRGKPRRLPRGDRDISRCYLATKDRHAGPGSPEARRAKEHS